MTDKWHFPRSTFVGFDSFLDELNNTVKHSTDHYPPHNVIRVGEHDYQIELAVAGFEEDELEVNVKERSLTITGEHVSRGREFIHRGISTKKFKRTFRLSEYVEVTGATFMNGLLVIELKVIVPEMEQPRKINISRGNTNEEVTN